MTDLVERLRAALDEAEIHPLHQLSCQMLKVPPEGFPFATFTCNCDGPDERRRVVAAHRKILDLHEPTRPPRNLTAPAAWCGRCSEDRPYEYMSESWPCQTVKALAGAYGVEGQA